MKSTVRVWATLIMISISGAVALAETPATPDNARSTSPAALVRELEEAFLTKLETTSEPEILFDEHEARLRQIIQQHPGQPDPFIGLMELFEKCETPRTLRLLNESLGREDLPEKIRVAYEQIRKTVNLIGTPIDLDCTALDGGTLRVAEFRGAVVLIDFWATWCGPCVRELPKLQALYGQHRRADLVIVGVSFDRDLAKLESFLKTRAVPWPQIYPDAAERERIARNLGVTGGYLPTVFLVGRDGRIRHTLNSRFRMAEKIAALLQE